MADFMLEALAAAGMAPRGGGAGSPRGAAASSIGSRRGPPGIGAFLRGTSMGSSMIHAGLFGGHGGGALIGQGLRESIAGAAQAGIPPNLLLSDRDFTADDYETLLRLDERVENRRGASRRDIEALPTHVARGPAGGSEASAAAGKLSHRNSDVAQCSVCLEDVASGQVMRLLPCAHRFHKDCIDKWLQQKASCPICQRSL